MQSISFGSTGSGQTTVHFALFQDVENAKALRTRIIAAAQEDVANHEREALNFCFISAHLITSQLHLQTAILQAILADLQGTLRTKTVHSEILWALNPTHNITDAIRRYGVNPDVTSMIVVRIGGENKSPEEIENAMSAAVRGKMVPFSSLESITDWTAVKKHYKLNGEKSLQTINGDITREHLLIDNIVVSTVAMKSLMS